MSSNRLAEKLERGALVLDGAIGTEFYERGFFINVCYESLCLTQPDVVRQVHTSYVEAGAQVLTTNSYAANRPNLNEHGLGDKLDEINTTAVKLARECGGEQALVAGSLGPLGKLDVPRHELDNTAVQVLSEQAKVLEDAGADFLIFETLPSRRDAIRAVRAADAVAIPYVLSFKVNSEAEAPSGEPCTVLLQALEVAQREPEALGLNCGDGAKTLLDALEVFMPAADYPILVQPNAGLPKAVDNRMMFMLSGEYFATYGRRYVDMGARGVGGCCGVGPAHIAELARSLRPVQAGQFSHQITVDHDEDKLQEPVPQADKSALGKRLAAGEWVTSVEIVPPRGYSLDKTIAKAVQCREAGIDAINIPDGPRASSRISPIVTAQRILTDAGIEPVLHFCCRDKNLIGMQADLLGCAAQGINNILFITGDPPKLGDYSFASGVFDVDAIGIVKFQDLMNRGIDMGGKKLKTPTRTLIGVGADPNALDFDAEVARTQEKVEAGAEYIITQPVFNTDALRKYLEEISDFRIPVIAGIWPLVSLRNAEFMRNEVPGVVVPDAIMERMSKHEQKDDQLAEGLDIARESIAEIRADVDGAQVSAPFGKVSTAIDVITNSDG